MEIQHNRLREKIDRLLESWQKNGLPSRQGLVEAADRLAQWKKKERLSGLWSPPLTMVTATIDDGWGHGLDIIHRYATVAGVSIHPLGLLRLPEEIIDACKARRPDILGLTVLQFSSDDDLLCISGNLPKKTRIIAGGPVFNADPDFAADTGVHHVAKNAAAFLELLLSWPPEDNINV